MNMYIYILNIQIENYHGNQYGIDVMIFTYTYITYTIGKLEFD